MARARGWRANGGLLLGLSMVLATAWKGTAHRGCCRQAAFLPPAPLAPSAVRGLLSRQGWASLPSSGMMSSSNRRREGGDVLMMAAAKGASGKQQSGGGGLFGMGKKTSDSKTVTKKKVVKAKSTKAPAQKQQAAGRKSKYQRQTLQRDDSWDAVNNQRIPLSSVVVGGGAIAAVTGYFGQKWWTKRHAQLITDFVDDMMDAGADKRELAKTVVSYKSKLGPFSTPRLLKEYLKVVFRAPDLSPAFIEAMDYVINSLLRVNEKDLFASIADVTKEMAKAQEYVGMSILLFTFERILPPELATSRLEPIRRVVSKVFPGDVADHMFELARDAYSLEVEMMYKRGEPPLVVPGGYEVLGLREKDAEEVFKKIKADYAPPASALGADGDLSQTLIVRKRDPIHDMIYGRAEDICDKHIQGHKENKEKKAAEKNRGRPPTWDETVERISMMVLSKEGEEVMANLQKFQCLRCKRLTTLMPGEVEDEVFHKEYECPNCKSGRDMIVRRS